MICATRSSCVSSGQPEEVRRADEAHEQLGADAGVDAPQLALLDAGEDRFLREAQDLFPPPQQLLAPAGRAVGFEERKEKPPAPVEAQVLAGDALEAPRGRALLGERLGKHLGEPIQDVERRREVEVVLGFEVPIDRPLADPGVGGDLVDEHTVERLRGEDLRRGVQDGSLFCFGLDSRHDFRPIPELTSQFCITYETGRREVIE